MFGLSNRIKDALGQVVEDLFDRIALQFIGNIPSLKNKKNLIISSENNFGLAHLFIQAMGNKAPNEIEQDTLAGLLTSTHGYIESLKSKTRSNIAERIDGIAREANIKNEKMDPGAVQAVVDEELGKAKSHMSTIVETEGTKFRNIGTVSTVAWRAGELGDNDPTVYFLVFRDKSNCSECIRLHFMPDRVTPRLWRLSELNHGYHVRGGDRPSSLGLHPHCSCTLQYLAKGMGFDEMGYLHYVSEDHDAYLKQK